MVCENFEEFVESLKESSMDIDTFSTYSDSAMKNAFGSETRTFAGSRGSYGNPNFLVRLKGFGEVRADLQQNNRTDGYSAENDLGKFEVVEVKDSETGETFVGKVQRFEKDEKGKITTITILNDDEELKTFQHPYNVSKVK